MGLQGIFQSQFNDAATWALATGGRGVFVEVCTYGVAHPFDLLVESAPFLHWCSPYRTRYPHLSLND